jgi:adenylylsulfate kinase
MNQDPLIVWHEQTIGMKDRLDRYGHRAGVLWFTGLSGSGKSTIANATELLLWNANRKTYLLDGDNVRHSLCATPNILLEDYSNDFSNRFGLGFSAEDREENIRRVGAAAGLIVNAGLIVLTAFVSPYRKDRDRVRKKIENQFGNGSFFEVFVNTPIEVCESRDPKGLYKLARAGKIPNFTGVSDPYEAPESPELILQGDSADPPSLAQQVLDQLKAKQWFS